MRIGTLKDAAALEARTAGLGFQSPNNATVSFSSISEMAQSGVRGLEVSSKSVELAAEHPQVGLSTTPKMGPRVM